MATTQLSPSAIPGKRYSFSPKAPAAGAHTGTFTELSVTATPGPIHSFSAKDAAAPESGPHTGLFTELSIFALPGQRHSFSAKTPFIAPVTPEPEAKPIRRTRGASGEYEYEPSDTAKRIAQRRRILTEDNELMELAAYIVSSGILE